MGFCEGGLLFLTAIPTSGTQIAKEKDTKKVFCRYDRRGMGISITPSYKHLAILACSSPASGTGLRLDIHLQLTAIPEIE